MRKKVLLLHPNFKEYSLGKEWEENESLSPPLGLLYLAAPLMKDYNVKFIDLNVENFEKKDFLQLLKEQDFLLISCYTGNMNSVYGIINNARKANKELIIICGGPHCNMINGHVKGSDYTCIGEAEEYIKELLDKIVSGKNVNNIPGLCYVKNKKTVQNPGIMKVDNLDKSMFPALELAVGKDYGYIAGLRIRAAPIMSSRGCPFNCKYCTHKGRIKYRERSPESVINEIKKRVKNGYKYFFFGDDNFLLNKDRVMKIMDAIIREKLKIKMIVQGRVDSADYEVYKKLRKAGVIMIMYGIENINQDVLDYYNKKITVEQIINAITLADKVGIISFGYFILGSPIETMKHYECTKKFFDKYPLDIILNDILVYVKGAELWDEFHKKGIIKDDELSIVSDERFNKFTTKELFRIKNDLLKHFYTNPKRILRLHYKIIKAGELGLLLKALLSGAYFKFFNFMKSPYELAQRG
ncbi:hypothetical protein COX58_02735 [archaeon CG_4_10_14_0_2_um_filter_Archaea_38_6]|nr:MAG: hypothetical protein COS64_00120 [archaeon CG06_land_8_20_14_3_00_37_11]PJA22136.1 MAG: hypothetical protein COX58_02735 [archaeon CG_4_10_14_0_2_um_filter_Archaea_38_6]